MDPPVILTEVMSLVSPLPVNVARRLASHTLFGQENPKLTADNAPTSMSETQRVRNLEEKLDVLLQ